MAEPPDASRKDVEPPRRFARELPSPVGAHPFDCLLTPQRAALFRQVLARRSARVAVVVEDCHDPHNATAAMRTCEALGVHHLWVSTAKTAFKINKRIAQGSHRYIELHVCPDIAAAYDGLRAAGYRIWATDLRADAVSGPQSLRRELADGGKVALVFGSEGFGLSRAASAGADGHVLIPMAGFVQSLNLSVSVAISVYALRGDELAADAPGDLDAAEQIRCYERWVGHQHPEATARLKKVALAALPTPGVDKRGEELDVYGKPSAPR